jgi:hypothetical protein
MELFEQMRQYTNLRILMYISVCPRIVVCAYVRVRISIQIFIQICIKECIYKLFSIACKLK